MIGVWYDAATNALWVNSYRTESFPARSLVVASDGVSTITIWRSIGTAAQPTLTTKFDQIARADGSGFASLADCFAYLQGEFAKPVVGPLIAVGDGAPDPALNALAYIDRDTGDLYSPT